MPSKQANTAADISSFTLSFLIQVTTSEEDDEVVKEGFLHLESTAVDGRQISYRLYPGYSYSVEVAVWPQVAKVVHQGRSVWVRTWLHQKKKWLAFSIRHAFHPDVYEMRKNSISAVIKEGTNNIGTASRSISSTPLYVPRLQANERPQFAQVIANHADHYSIERYLRKLLWGLVKDYIPSSHLDGEFNVPFEVTDIRHQDALLRAADDTCKQDFHKEPSQVSVVTQTVPKKKSDKKRTTPRFLELKIAGDALLSGVGYVRSDVVCLSESCVAMLISSNYLPPKNEHPVLLVNIHKLENLPKETLTSSGFDKINTKWRILKDEYSSAMHPLSNCISIKDSRAIPLEPNKAAEILTIFQDTCFEIEIHATKLPPSPATPELFGNIPTDESFGLLSWPAHQNEESDVHIASCLLDLKCFIVGNKIMRGSFPIVPSLGTSIQNLPSIILDSTATLSLCVGFVGCKPKPIQISYSRMVCYIAKLTVTQLIVEEILEINESQIEEDKLLTGWVADWADAAIIYVEGPRESVIDVWMKTLEYDVTQSSYSTHVRFKARLYPKLIEGSCPFVMIYLNISPRKIIMKKEICSQTVLQLPARKALLKLARLELSGVDCGWAAALPTELELANLRVLLEQGSDLRRHLL